MVMHARKVARLDDGYRDLNQPEILSKDKSLSNSHSTKYGDRKASKFDNFDHRRRSNSPRSRSGHYDNKTRERRNYEDADGGNRDSKSSKEQKHKDHKSEVHRLAERVCGDWSEHISKSGKRYFYNCRTEVSQWEKPDCWTEETSNSNRNPDKVLHDSSDRSKSSSSSKANSHVGDSRHSISNNNNKSTSSKSRKDGLDSRISSREEQRSPAKTLPSAREANSTSLKDRTSRQDRKRPHSRRSSSRSPAHSQKSGKYGSRGSSSEAGSGGCYRNSSAKNDSGNGGITGKKRDKGNVESTEVESFSKEDAAAKEADDIYKNSPVHEDMDISPDNSFSQGDIETRTSQDGLNLKSSPLVPAAAAMPSGGVAGSNGDVAHLDRPSVQAPSSSSSNQETLFHCPTSSVASNSATAAATSSAAWSGSSSSGAASSSSSSSNNNNNNPSQQPHQQQHQQSLQTTLAGLQQAVLRLIPDKVSASVSGQQSQSSSQANFASCVALLPVLLAQLSSQQQSGSGGSNSDNQLIIQQAIPLLKKLQEIVVHQQQQQQQRKLQHVLFQLLQMQNSGSNVQSNSSQRTPGNDNKAESPYSPPDSDGSPVQTPSNNSRHATPHHHHSRQAAAAAATTNRQSPRQPLQEAGHHQSSASKQSRQEKSAHHPSSNATEDAEDRPDGVSFGSSLHSKMDKSDGRPSANSQQQSLSSGGSQAQGHHVGVPFYRRNEIELTPGLADHFNPKAIEHVSNWQADSLVKQADCIAADNYSYLAPLCCQVSVELKQARSMVRAQEILSTRHEQRRIVIQHQLYELDRGLSIPSLFPPNPILMTFTQQQQQQQQQLAPIHLPQQLPPPQQQQQVSHPTLTPQTSQTTPVPTPLSPPAAPVVPPHADPSSPAALPPPEARTTTMTSQTCNTSVTVEETPRESLSADLT